MNFVIERRRAIPIQRGIMISAVCTRVICVYMYTFKYRQLESLIEHRFDGSLFDTACFNTIRDTSAGDFNYMYGYLSTSDNDNAETNFRGYFPHPNGS